MSDEKPINVSASARQPHSRVIKTRPVTFTCIECGQEVTEDLFPGPPPKYCNNCVREVRKRQTAERVRNFRVRQRKGG